MIRNVLSHIGGVEIYGIASVLLFFAFFTGMLIWAFRLKPGHLESMGRLPLDDGQAPTESTNAPCSPPSKPGSNPCSRHECE